MLAALPNAPQRMLQLLAEVPPSVLRLGGVTMMLLGTFVVWLLRG